MQNRNRQPTRTAGPNRTHEVRAQSDKGRKGHNNELATLTNPPPIPKGRCTRLWLRVISQEPFGIEFHRIDVSNWVVKNLPAHHIGSPWGKEWIGNEL